MLKKLCKIISNVDLWGIEKIMKQCNESNVQKFTMDYKTNSIEIIYKENN